MRKYEVIGSVATVGAGEVLELTEAQFKPRAHNVDVMEKVGRNGGTVCRAKAPLQFIVGEILWLASPPPVHAAQFKAEADPAPAELDLKTGRKSKPAG